MTTDTDSKPAINRESRFDMPSSVSGQDFRRWCASWATGVAVVTTNTESGTTALTMNAVTSLSLDPPLMLICVAKTAETLPAIKRSGVFCINVLAVGQEEVSNQCAKKGSNKLDLIPHHEGVSGAPVIDGALVALECRIAGEMDGGDHVIFVGDVVAGNESEGAPLTYYRGTYGSL